MECNNFVFLDIYNESSLFKDTHREKGPLSNKTPVLTKSMNMDIWVVDTSNQLFLRDSSIDQN